MSWLTDAFAQQSVAWLILSTIVAIVAGFLTSWLTYRFKRQEIVDSAAEEIKNKKTELEMQEKNSRDERIRREVVRWANPILGAVGELTDRLRNILEQKGYFALYKIPLTGMNPNWSISYEYFMSSTLYLFGQYFAWVQMLQDKLSFELFQSQKEKDKFFNAIREVGSSLSDFPPKYECSGKDTQIFRLQQKAIGELFITHDGDNVGCLSYPDFFHGIEDPTMSLHIKPLKLLLEDLNPNDECRWKRVVTSYEALKRLKTNCEELLSTTSISER
jgi:hypothetical protein